MNTRTRQHIYMRSWYHATQKRDNDDDEHMVAAGTQLTVWTDNKHQLA